MCLIKSIEESTVEVKAYGANDEAYTIWFKSISGATPSSLIICLFCKPQTYALLFPFSFVFVEIGFAHLGISLVILKSSATFILGV